eukprot:PhM_4_TR5249/c0_g1_i1/m.42271
MSTAVFVGPYDKTQKYEGFLEKKSILGFSKKWIAIQGNKLTFADTEMGEPKGEIVMHNLVRAVEAGGDLLGLNITTKGATDTWNLRAVDQSNFFDWYNLLYSALQAIGRRPPKNYGLPAEDPRTKLPFLDIPLEHLAKFHHMDSAVVHWFQQVKKIGVKSSSVLASSKHPIEDRYVMLGDRYIYVCKPSGDFTRCMKIMDVVTLYTSPSTSSDGLTVGVHMKAPDYDIVFCSKDGETFVERLKTLYRYHTKGREIKHEQAEHDVIVSKECTLARPAGWEFALVLPTSKSQLKKAFDVFAAKTGVKVLPAAEASPSAEASASSSTAASSAPTTTAAAAGGAADSLRSDPMGLFLAKLGIESYYEHLRNQKVDLDVLEYMDDGDLQHFGITDAAHRAMVLDAFTKQTFLEGVVEEAAKYKSGAVVEEAAPTRKPDAPGPSQAPAAAQPAPTSAPVIDDDDDFGLPAPKPKPKISLDDDDDFDLPAPAPKAAPAAGGISLDDDDDLGIVPAKPAPKKSIDLDDDI